MSAGWRDEESIGRTERRALKNLLSELFGIRPRGLAGNLAVTPRPVLEKVGRAQRPVSRQAPEQLVRRFWHASTAGGGLTCLECDTSP
jgi:hypothetical protein